MSTRTQALERSPFQSERPLGANGSDTTGPRPGPKAAAAGATIASGSRPAPARPVCGPLDAPRPRPASHTLAAWLRPGPPGRGRRERKRKRRGKGETGKGETGKGEGKGDHCAHRQHEYLWARGPTRARSGRGDPAVSKPCPRTDDRARGRACPSPVEGSGPRGWAGARGGIPPSQAGPGPGRRRDAAGSGLLTGLGRAGAAAGKARPGGGRPRTHITGRGPEPHPGSPGAEWRAADRCRPTRSLPAKRGSPWRRLTGQRRTLAPIHSPPGRRRKRRRPLRNSCQPAAEGRERRRRPGRSPEAPPPGLQLGGVGGRPLRGAGFRCSAALVSAFFCDSATSRDAEFLQVPAP